MDPGESYCERMGCDQDGHMQLAVDWMQELKCLDVCKFSTCDTRWVSPEKRQFSKR